MADQPVTKVMVLDDDRGLLALCSRVLSRRGHTVVTAASIAEAESLLVSEQQQQRRGGVDLIVVDYQLDGGMSGLEFFRELARRGAAPPAILVTGFSDEKRVLEALRSGLRDVIRKTEDFLEHLPVTVERVLREVRAERVAVEADALRDSEQRLRLALETGGMGAWEYDVGSTLLRCSEICHSHFALQCHVGGEGQPHTSDAIPYEELLGRIHPDDRANVRRTFAAVVRSGETAEAEFRVVLEYGRTRWLLARAKTIERRAGQATVVTGVTLDVTARRDHEDELRRAKEDAEAYAAQANAANNAKDEFLAVLSHELRTPLTPVLSTAQSLHADPNLSPTMRDAMAMIRRNVELEARLIDDLLDLTRVSRGKLMLSPTLTDLHEKVNEVVAICESEIRGNGQILTLNLAATRRRLLADPARLQQVLWNLLKNAVKFTPAGGRIVVATADAPQGGVLISVVDTGIGMSAEQLPKVFDAFEQGEKAVTRKFGGLGLGLAITRSLVVLHGGSIKAESAGRNLGATFTVYFPTAVAAPAASQPTTNGSSVRAVADAVNRPRLSILLVEDHPDTALALSRLLKTVGHDVRTADSVAEGTRAVESHPFDLLISDIGLPDGSGLDLMRQVRTKFALPGIVLSGFGTEEDVRRSRDAGFALHLTKPVSMDALRHAIEQISVVPGKAPAMK